jgi:transcriptional regulator with PAS, ATPase and Fis domain
MRIIAASSRELEKSAAQGKLRHDPYYRLNVLSFHLPPLRKRRQNIEALARGMVERFVDSFGKSPSAISPGALVALRSFPWPGNIRQLGNAMQHVVLVSSGSELLKEHLPVRVRQPAFALGPFPNP